MATPPIPQGPTGQRALGALLRERSVLPVLEILNRELGDVFRIPLPVFNAVVLAGPEANHFVLVDEREQLRWRLETDPVARLLRHGVLVEDGAEHDRLRRLMMPALHKRMLDGYVECMWRRTDQVSAAWTAGSTRDMLVEMRKTALLILVDTLFGQDFTPHMQRLWDAILRTLQYISPGPWILWSDIPRPGYARARRDLDAYLYAIARARRAAGAPRDDMLGALVAAGLDDDLIRDQLLTMFIAGHDTSTALLAWALHLLAEHPHALKRARAEVDAVLRGAPPAPGQLAQLDFLERVVKETLRLYPPIHLGNRVAARDLQFGGYRIPAGTRVLYSIYLSHRQPQYWPDPQRFDPERFTEDASRARVPYTYVPFGGGPRNCIGSAFAQVEVKVVLARLLQTFDFAPGPGRVHAHVHAHMGATLEPRPGVPLQVRRRD